MASGARPLDVLFATAKIHPGLHEDDHPLLDLLKARGIPHACAVWDDPSVDWSAAKTVVIRSTWDYHRRRDEYLAWVDRAAEASSFWNPAPVVRWNTHKGYLRELEAAGVPVTPTVWFAKGASGKDADLRAIARERGWAGAVVVKPVVSADAFGAAKFEPGDLARGQEHLQKLLATEEAMAQPYLRSVEEHGERSMLFLDGELSHSVRKQPAFRPKTSEANPADFSPQEAAAARKVMEFVAAKFPTPMLYARVDLVPDDAGVLRLMELELTEPTLFLKEGGPPAVERLARGIIARANARAG